MDEIPGTRESKRRAKLILQTITGELSVKEACEVLGIGPSQFANLRTLFLRYGVEGLQPQPIGRPRRASVISLRELDLRQRNEDLERENRILKAQVEVAGLRRNHAATRSKSVGKTAKRPPSPRSDAAGGAVP